MKIEHGTTNTLVIKSLALGPSKKYPGSGFDKNKKIYEKTIGKSTKNKSITIEKY